MQAKSKMKKYFFKISKFFGLAFISIILLFEIYYYTDFSGYRLLTPGEIEMSKSVYSDHIDYLKVKIYCRKFMPNPIQNDWTAISPNGNIFFPKAHCSEDFSLENLHKQGRFIHEMVHVYQYQHEGQAMFRKALKLIVRDTFIQHKNIYDYTLDLDKDFDDYTIEQQGEIMRDYFLYLHGKKSFSDDEIEWYGNIIS